MLNQETQSENIVLPYSVEGEFFVDPVDVKNKLLYRFFKRFFDITVSLVLLLLCFVPMVIIGILVKLTSKGPALYFQPRLGLNGKRFRVVKFRSMCFDAEKDGVQWSAGKEDERITKFGSFLKKTRLDELPQLWCIFIGTMSFVGPRPEREVFYDAFETYIHGFRERLKVKPGLTGLAQVNGGYDLKPEEKIMYDMEYIRRRSCWLDFKIMLKTVGIVFSASGAK
ncbi:MAG: sugar transferase [Clostridia bacterium]|nr:sugar transferase [Clostridia bacterium]